MPSPRSRLLLGFVLLCFLGCGGPPPPQPAVEGSLQLLFVLFGQFSSQHQGKTPQNEQEFLEFVKQLPPNRLADAHVASPEDLLKSPRDKQPLTIIYGQPMSMPGMPDAKPLAYEQTGVSGSRFVLLTNGRFEEANTTRFAQLVPAQ